MRRRILGVAVSTAVVATLLFAVPLAIAVQRLFFAEEQAELERAGEHVAASVDPAFDTSDTPDLPAVPSGMSSALYSAAGARVVGSGPDKSPSVALALTGEVIQAQEAGSLVVVLPVTAQEKVIGAVRVATPLSRVWLRIVLTWILMLGLALLAIGVAVAAARRQARRLTRPMEELAAAATSLGEGNFVVHTQRCGVPEIDQTSAALTSTAARLGELVQRERDFSANASHQLRTPLTGLRLGLESALGGTHQQLSDAASAAIKSADDLERTINDLLILARTPTHASNQKLDLPHLLDELSTRWHGVLAASGRRLIVTTDPGLPPTSVSAAALRQVLDVLVENALQHGSGEVSVLARDADDALAIDVSDQGGGLTQVAGNVFQRGTSGRGGPGIGLSMARELVQGQGGRLLLTRTSPTTNFAVLLPLTVDQDSRKPSYSG